MLGGKTAEEIIVMRTKQPSITGTPLVKLQNAFVLKWQEHIKIRTNNPRSNV